MAFPFRISSHQEGAQLWRAHGSERERRGIVLPHVVGYVPDHWKEDWHYAMDALPALTTTDPNSAVPALLTTYMDPEVFRALWAPLRAAEIMGEQRKGDWLTETAMFPVIEATGEVSSYGDWNMNGRAGLNTNWPQRQAYRYQIIIVYGELEMERAGLARINWVSELNKAAALSMNKFQNYVYFFGLAGLQNYGLLNDPNLTASLTPGVKAAGAGNNAWINSATGAFIATANEVYADFQSLFFQLVRQTAGLVTRETPMIWAMSPGSEVALTLTNTFNVNVYDLVKKNFPKIEVISATQYGATNATYNPQQGLAGGNLTQLIVPELEGQKTGYCAYTEKMRSHPIIRQLSAFEQKMSGGVWGTVLRMTASIASMLGV